MFKQSVQSFFNIKELLFSQSLKTCYMIHGCGNGSNVWGAECSRGRCPRGLSGHLTPLLIGPVCL